MRGKLAPAWGTAPLAEAVIGTPYLLFLSEPQKAPFLWMGVYRQRRKSKGHLRSEDEVSGCGIRLDAMGRTGASLGLSKEASTAAREPLEA